MLQMNDNSTATEKASLLYNNQHYLLVCNYKYRLPSSRNQTKLYLKHFPNHENSYEDNCTCRLKWGTLCIRM